ncbi:MAG: signal recognition particle-docking protein FtsY [Candidatus Marinimicrobia bacterium]|nr:signal recognition particle-docking protein FtsY [Candidatus Neomarinimicrobiota bacterium]
MALFGKVFQALQRTRSSLTQVFSSLTGKRIDEETLEDIEYKLLSADLGIETTDSILDIIQKSRNGNAIATVKEHLSSILPQIQSSSIIAESGPTVLMIVGVNGTGKTTSTAKLASYFRKSGKKVLLIGADTYRAAAVEQLRIWSKRLGIRLVCNEKSQEPASVLYNGMEAAKAEGSDLIIVDTAGRLHTYKNLMQELQKMYRVLDSRFPEFNVQSWIIIDANLGQNSLIQAKEFGSHVKLHGAVLTKMDGTAKGGIVFPLYQQLKIPVQFIGIGETLDDIFPFDPQEYVDSLFGD